MANQAHHTPITEERKSFHVRSKRSKSYWEPIFNPDVDDLLQEFNWDTNQIEVVKNSLCTSARLQKVVESFDPLSWKGRNLKFIKCDFTGDFNLILSFYNCNFFECDMGSTIWRGTKFSNCNFDRCSFTIATFEHCNFHNCTWKEIGISGTETKLFDTIITNPESFINSAYTNINEDILKNNGGATPEYQTLRLEESKVKLARLVLSNNERNADDMAYYESIKTYLKQSINFKIKKAEYERNARKNIIKNIISQYLGLLEKNIVSLSGFINGWGGNISRAAMVGFFMILFFSIVYYFSNFGSEPMLGWKLSFIKSIDITLLIGYTKHATTAQTWQEQALYGCNALFGLWWYAIFVPTIISRICRVR